MTCWYSGWFCPHNDTVKYTKMPCALHHLQFAAHDNLSQLIHEERAAHRITKGSSLALLRDIYLCHAALDEAPPPPSPLFEGGDDDDDDEWEEEERPTITVPRIHYCTHYTLVALNGRDLQAFVRTYVDPNFRLSPLLWRFCEFYGVDIVKTFPSQRTEDALKARPLGVARKTQATSTLPPPADGTGVYDNDDLYGPGADPRALLAAEAEAQRQEQMASVEAQHREQMARHTEIQRRRHEEETKVFTRLIPVCLLPLLLQMLPDYYQSATNTVSECVALTQALLRSIPTAAFPSYVHEQLEALHTNTMYVAYRNQKSALCGVTNVDTEFNRLHTLEIEELRRLHQTEMEDMAAQIECWKTLYEVALKKGVPDAAATATV